MYVQADSLQASLVAAIDAQGELAMAEPRVTHAASLRDAVVDDAAETVELFAAPYKPARSTYRLNRIGAALDALVIPDNVNATEPCFASGSSYKEYRSSGNPWGILIGVRRYKELRGRAEIVMVDASEPIDLHREIILRIFPNIRLAYDASQGEDLRFIGPFRRLRSRSELRRVGTDAVKRL